jgi:hypothetical protein
MKSSNCLLSLLVLAVSAFGGTPTRAADSIGYFEAIATDPLPMVGQQYYTRYCFMYDKGVFQTTNYWRGTLLPINSQVTLVALGGESMTLRLASGGTVKVENIEKFSRRSMSQVSHEMLALHPVPIEKFNEATVNFIKGGILKTGMTKEQVIMARGYPPGHKTPSVDADVWVYWSSRVVTDTLVFSNGVLTQGREVR